MAIFTAIASAVGAISAFIGTTLAAGGIGAFLLRTAVGIGLNLLASAIAGKPKAPTFSINGTLQSGGDVPRSFIFGRTATAGSLVWVNTWGDIGDTPNAFLTQVIALSDLPGASLDELWVNGEKVTIDYDKPHADGRGYQVKEYTKDGNASLWVQYHDGTQAVADSFLINKASNGQRTWEPTRVGVGVCYAIVTAKVTKNMFSGIPNFKFVLTGPALYDPSRDDTVGGVGSQRADNPATWGGDGDHLPAVHIYNLLHGLTYNNSWFYGLQGVGATRLPVANWIEQINKCRGTGDEPVYRAGGEITIDAPLATALEALLTACQGRIAEVGGTYSIYVGEPDSAVASFTDGDILSTEEQSFTPFFGLADTINGIAATYPSPEDGWSEKSAPPLYRTDLEALAGNRRLMADVSLAFVPYPEQVQRLMKSALAEGQRARRHTLVLPPAFWPYAVPGAILSWTSERNGYVGKLFRVDGAVDRANLDVMIDVTEVDPADFDWDSDTDYDVPVDGAVGAMRPTPQPIVDWSASADSVKDNDGVNRRPAIKLAWDNSEGRLHDVIGIEFEVRLAATHETVYGGRTDQPEAGALLISQGLLPLTQYEVRVRYIPGGDRETPWSGWLLVTTLDIRITDVTAYLSGVGQDVYATLQQIRSDYNDLRARMEMIAAATAEATGKDIELHTVSRRFRDATAVAMREMTTSIEAKTTVYRQDTAPSGDLSDGDIWIDTDDGNKVRVWNATTGTWEEAGAKGLLTFAQDEPPTASNVGDLWIDTNDNSRLYRWDGTDWVDVSDARITAQASILDAVQSAVGNISADGLRKIEVTAGTGDIVARLTDMVRATIDDDWVEAGTVTEVGFEGGDPAKPFSRIVMFANQIIFADPAGQWLPVVIEDGVGYFNNARIKDLTADNITAKSLDADVVMQNGTIITDLIGFDQLTGTGTDSVNTGTIVFPNLIYNTWITVASFVCENPNPRPPMLFYRMQATVNRSGGTLTAAMRFVRNVGGTLTELQQDPFSVTNGSLDTKTIVIADPGAPQGTYTYEVQYRLTQSTVQSPSAVIKADITGIWGKR